MKGIKISKNTGHCEFGISLFNFIRIVNVYPYGKYWYFQIGRFRITFNFDDYGPLFACNILKHKTHCPSCGKTIYYDAEEVHFCPDVEDRAFRSKSGRSFIWCPNENHYSITL